MTGNPGGPLWPSTIPSARCPDPGGPALDIDLINDQNPMARDALKIAGRPGKKEGIRYRGPRLGDLPIEEAYIYPKPAIPLRQSFTITYERQSETNQWLATTRKRELSSLGASTKERCPTRRLNGWVTRKGREDFAPIHVLVEVDPSLDERTIATNPVILDDLLEQARSMADEMFKEKHPDASDPTPPDLASNAMYRYSGGLPDMPDRIDLTRTPPPTESAGPRGRHGHRRADLPAGGPGVRRRRATCTSATSSATGSTG